MLVLYDAETGRVMGSTIPQLIENTNTNYEDFLKDQNLDNYFWVQGSTFHNQVGIIVLHSRDELNRFVFFDGDFYVRHLYHYSLDIFSHSEKIEFISGRTFGPIM